MTDSDIRAKVQAYYGSFLQESDDLRTDACCCSETPPPKYVLDALNDIEDDILDHFYGCGSPIPPALEGATVLDLGCGTGRDVYIASKLVGPTGHVIGVDMTPSQLDFARKYEAAQMERFGFAESNVEFVESYIEDMAAIPSESVDVVISNCVVNLSPFKNQLFAEVFRVLKPGGELFFSDIFSDRRVPEGFYDDPVLRGECLSGAMYIEDFRRMLAENGVATFYDVECDEVHIGDLRIATKLGCIGFYSHTVRAVKGVDLESREEDYGQVATYLGTMPENKRYFDLSSQVRLIKGRPVAVSGNMAALLQGSRYAPHFTITPRKQHRGGFDFAAANQALALQKEKERIGLADLQDACAALGIEPWEQRVHDKGFLETTTLTTMQVNVTYKCNLACNHCYLQCSPKNDQEMSRETMEAVLVAFRTGGFKTMDITGGSPEMNPNLEWFIGQAAQLADEVIVRSNLTILQLPEYHHFMQVYAANKVKLVCSLPYFTQLGCDNQRGGGVFRKVMDSLHELNELGYGRTPELQIDLVYNVDGPFLPPDQRELADLYKYELQRAEGVDFNGMYAFNNYCLGRFANQMKAQQKFDYYLKLLSDNYNGAVVARIMCRSQINVDWDGGLYDCEVNHVLGLPINGPANVRDIVDAPLAKRTIVSSPICYSCSAGCGSSCGGSLLEKQMAEEAAF
ncbi:MAG: arsenosugar biosynthesis radical SAM protein ArsS [Coriobacteriia bacterium]|nr:arsenosugar biosynthesis radical SAM protein ArsS [Coriobacteriia bacterium]